MAKVTSSITDKRMKSHLTDEAVKLRSELSCDHIPGFFLMKGKTGGTWYFRYWDSTGTKHVYKIGNIKTARLNDAGEDPRNMKRTRAIEEALVLQAGIARREYPHTLKEQAKQRARDEDALLKRTEEATLGKYLEGPFKAYQSRKAEGGRSTLNILRSNFSKLLDRPLASLTAADIKEWQHEREEEERAYATLKRAFGALRTLLNRAVEDGVIQAMPFSAKALQDQRADHKDEEHHRHEEEEQRKRRMLTDDEVEALWRGLDLYDKEKRRQRESSRAHGKPHLPDLSGIRFVDWFEPAVTLAYFSGVRPGDLYGLRWVNISFVDVGVSRLRFVPKKTRHHIDPAKVDIALHPDADAVLRAWWQQCGKPESGYLFTTEDGRALDRQAHKNKWTMVKTLGGLPKELDFYCLRHHFISHLLDKGQSMKLIAEAVGHKSTAMIERNYGHVSPDRKDEALLMMSGRVVKEQINSRKTY